MYKFVIGLITLSAIAIVCYISNLVSPENENINFEILKMQTYFVYSAIGLTGILVSGAFNFGKNNLQPYHLAQISLGFIYLFIELCMLGFVFTQITENTFLCVNLILSFLVLTPMTLLVLANFKSKTEVK